MLSLKLDNFRHTSLQLVAVTRIARLYLGCLFEQYGNDTLTIHIALLSSDSVNNRLHGRERGQWPIGCRIITCGSREFLHPLKLAPNEIPSIGVRQHAPGWQRNKIVDYAVVLADLFTSSQDTAAALHPLPLDGRACQNECPADLRNVDSFVDTRLAVRACRVPA